MADTTEGVTLLERTQYLARHAPRSIKMRHMADQCGVSIAWISRFINDKIDNPGIVTVQCLHDFLVSHSKD